MAGSLGVAEWLELQNCPSGWNFRDANAKWYFRSSQVVETSKVQPVAQWLKIQKWFRGWNFRSGKVVETLKLLSGWVVGLSEIVE